GRAGGVDRHYSRLPDLRLLACPWHPHHLPAQNGRTASSIKGEAGMREDIDLDNESQITLTRKIGANVSDVFSAWTDPALIEQWQVDEAEFDAHKGGEYRFVTFGDDEDEADHEVTGEILDYVEDKKLVMSWVHRDEE